MSGSGTQDDSLNEPLVASSSGANSRRQSSSTSSTRRPSSLPARKPSNAAQQSRLLPIEDLPRVPPLASGLADAFAANDDDDQEEEEVPLHLLPDIDERLDDVTWLQEFRDPRLQTLYRSYTMTNAYRITSFIAMFFSLYHATAAFGLNQQTGVDTSIAVWLSALGVWHSALLVTNEVIASRKEMKYRIQAWEAVLLLVLLGSLGYPFLHASFAKARCTSTLGTLKHMTLSREQWLCYQYIPAYFLISLIVLGIGFQMRLVAWYAFAASTVSSVAMALPFQGDWTDYWLIVACIWIMAFFGLNMCRNRLRVGRLPFRHQLRLLRDEYLTSVARTQLDGTLHTLMPSGTLERLAANKPVFDVSTKTTVSVCEVANFAEWANSLLPTVATEGINALITSFDYHLVSYGVEKVIACGDQYICGVGLSRYSGAPPPTDARRAAVLHFAFAQQQYAAVLRQRTGSPLSIRIGVASGTSFGGVLGSATLGYDAFGEAVTKARSLSKECPVGYAALTDEATLVLADGSFEVYAYPRNSADGAPAFIIYRQLKPPVPVETPTEDPTPQQHRGPSNGGRGASMSSLKEENATLSSFFGVTGNSNDSQGSFNSPGRRRGETMSSPMRARRRILLSNVMNSPAGKEAMALPKVETPSQRNRRSSGASVSMTSWFQKTLRYSEVEAKDPPRTNNLISSGDDEETDPVLTFNSHTDDQPHIETQRDTLEHYEDFLNDEPEVNAVGTFVNPDFRHRFLTFAREQQHTGVVRSAYGFSLWIVTLAIFDGITLRGHLTSEAKVSGSVLGMLGTAIVAFLHGMAIKRSATLIGSKGVLVSAFISCAQLACLYFAPNSFLNSTFTHIAVVGFNQLALHLSIMPSVLAFPVMMVVVGAPTLYASFERTDYFWILEAAIITGYAVLLSLAIGWRSRVWRHVFILTERRNVQMQLVNYEKVLYHQLLTMLLPPKVAINLDRFTGRTVPINECISLRIRFDFTKTFSVKRDALVVSTPPMTDSGSQSATGSGRLQIDDYEETPSEETPIGVETEQKADAGGSQEELSSFSAVPAPSENTKAGADDARRALAWINKAYHAADSALSRCENLHRVGCKGDVLHICGPIPIPEPLPPMPPPGTDLDNNTNNDELEMQPSSHAFLGDVPVIGGLLGGDNDEGEGDAVGEIGFPPAPGEGSINAIPQPSEDALMNSTVVFPAGATTTTTTSVVEQSVADAAKSVTGSSLRDPEMQRLVNMFKSSITVNPTGQGSDRVTSSGSLPAKPPACVPHSEHLMAALEAVQILQRLAAWGSVDKHPGVTAVAESGVAFANISGLTRPIFDISGVSARRCDSVLDAAPTGFAGVMDGFHRTLRDEQLAKIDPALIASLASFGEPVRWQVRGLERGVRVFPLKKVSDERETLAN